MAARERAVALGELIAALGEGAPAVSEPSLQITALAYDSREVRPGSLFFCVSGFKADGHDFAAQAVQRGAAALVVERPLSLGTVPEVLVSNARLAMAPLAARFYGHPSRELRVVGVTGTNGKTTTAYLVRALLEATGTRCGLLGTVKSVIGGQDRPVARTTPEAIDLQADLRAMLAAGDGACAMEVSSHALELGRADAVRFAAAIFTNLTQDHLDFHPTMEDYFLAKRRLFLPAAGVGGSGSCEESPGTSFVNVGDEYGRRLAEEVPGALTYAVEEEADYMATGVSCGPEGCRFRLRTSAGERPVALPMPGRFNVANAVGALAAVHALGGSLDALVAALEAGIRVPGRFEPVEEGQDFAVLVDYAHTPDSLENVLRSAREITPEGGRVICVFGAGGDRDRGKRPLMGEIAARLSDLALVTSDNPRSEEPEAIIGEILAGVGGGAGGGGGGGGAGAGAAGIESVSEVVDRREAIGAAIEEARAGDVLVIAGKGHEQGQELAGGRKVPFDDATVAREALTARREHRVAAAGAQ